MTQNEIDSRGSIVTSKKSDTQIEEMDSESDDENDLEENLPRETASIFIPGRIF